MSATRYASILGLGFGDCGKGRFVDALTRRWKTNTVARFNGGAQAGHNVVAQADLGSRALHHTFSQFGAGTLVPGVHTVLLHPMVLHPTALVMEANALARLGIHDALSRLTIDAQCRMTTPYHQAAGRVRELYRGTAAHGTCGVGVGETVRHALAHPEQALHYSDFVQTRASGERAQMDKLQATRETLLAEMSHQMSAGRLASADGELQVLQDESLAAKWLGVCKALAHQCPPASAEEIHTRLTQPGCVLFEGAQGVLLDEWRGFHPHTTWSSISTAAVERTAERFGIEGPVEHYGVLRSYLTRHGVGPFPTHDDTLDRLLPEAHNHEEGWQGRFRRGHPDAVLLRYALETVGDLSGLLLSHLDVFQRGVTLKWCERYSATSAAGSPCTVERLSLSASPDLAHQSMLAELLLNAQPQYAGVRIGSASALLERIAAITALPVILCSFAPDDAGVREP